jgi:hypothetical protein
MSKVAASTIFHICGRLWCAVFGITEHLRALAEKLMKNFFL